MKTLRSPLIIEWPEMNFDEIEKMKVDDKSLGSVNHYFFRIIHFPETILKEFYVFLKEGTI